MIIARTYYQMTFSSRQAQNDSGATARAGTIVVLIDESSEMAGPIAGGTKSKRESVATAVNSMLNQLAAGPQVRLAVVGYGGGDSGAAPVQIRWAGPLSGRALVDSSELAAAPLTVEERVRRIPGVGGIGVTKEETVRFPIWYVPAESGRGGIEQAADFVRRILAEAGDDLSGKPPLVLHLCAKLPPASELQSGPMQSALESSIWYHLHLGANERIPATLYPSSNQRLPNSDVETLFETSSPLAAPFAEMLRTAQVAVVPGARGLVHQAGMGDLIRFLGLAKAYASASAEPFASLGFRQPIPAPAPIAEQATSPDFPNKPCLPTCDRLTLIVLADRSQSDPACGAWLRRQEQVNDMLGRIAKRAGGDVDVGLIVYGSGTVEAGFSGPLQGRLLVPDVELAEGVLRVEQVTEKVSNGIGGLVELRRSRPIFVDDTPSQPVRDLAPVMAALIDLARTARESAGDRQMLTLAIHVTGGFSPETIAAGAARLRELRDVLLYHCIVPEIPQPTLAYPDSAERITDPGTAALWQITSPLAGAREISGKRPAINEASRGFVVGAKFDLLLESLQALLGKRPEH